MTPFKFLKLKSLFYLLKQGPLFKAFLKRPFFYLKRYFFQKKTTSSAFFHGIQSNQELQELIQDKSNLLLLGFSYCQKPLYCPSGRFTANCSFDPVLCQDCFIGKCFQKKLENSEKIIITTATSLAEKLLALSTPAFRSLPSSPSLSLSTSTASNAPSSTITTNSTASSKIIFLICACPLSLRLFQDFPALLDLKGRSFPLSGAVCASFPAFLAAEKGQKKEISQLSNSSAKEILKFLEIRKKALLR